MMKQRVKKSGFTLIELLVTLSIFLVMTSVVLARYRSYSVNADFANAVENIVLALREAQVYGSASKSAGGGIACGGSAFNCAYGVNFVNGGISYVVFVDSVINNTYDSPGEMIQTVSLPSGVSLSFVTPTLNIVFKRPFPDAIINNDPTNTSASVTVTYGENSQTITISSTGMISVQ